MGEERTSAFHAFVRGRVQGVGFRYTARSEAAALKLTGWVRNLDDGSVEVVAEGAPANLARFEAWLREGPTGSVVSRLDIDHVTPSGRYRGFTIEF